ncbi:MAG: hypothetical protein IT559_05410 [Alphaproteobacteria bacterium]|nr:hypothetical protein [Alphaproteobacteria bacterium]
MSEINLRNFNDHSKGVVFQRNLEREVGREPLLVKVDANADGSKQYVVHESTGVNLAEIWSRLNGNRANEGELKSYNEEEFTNKFGNAENMRTYDQYKADLDILRTTPGLGRNLAENKEIMKFRSQEIELDIKEAGELVVAPLQNRLSIESP